jgi:hypothetical protein
MVRESGGCGKLNTEFARPLDKPKRSIIRSNDARVIRFAHRADERAGFMAVALRAHYPAPLESAEMGNVSPPLHCCCAVRLQPRKKLIPSGLELTKISARKLVFSMG